MNIHNAIKIMYSNLGYLPGYPYYLISDKEMFDAFLRDDGFFADEYSCPCDDLAVAYNDLVECIQSKIDDFLTNGVTIPDWVYSYMIKSTVTYSSKEADIAYISEMMNIDMEGIIAEFTPEVARWCYEVSTKWLKKQPSKYQDRVPTMFGEPHVIKSLRLDKANVMLD